MSARVSHPENDMIEFYLGELSAVNFHTASELVQAISQGLPFWEAFIKKLIKVSNKTRLAHILDCLRNKISRPILKHANKEIKRNQSASLQSFTALVPFGTHL